MESVRLFFLPIQSCLSSLFKIQLRTLSRLLERHQQLCCWPSVNSTASFKPALLHFHLRVWTCSRPVLLPEMKEWETTVKNLPSNLRFFFLLSTSPNPSHYHRKPHCLTAVDSLILVLSFFSKKHSKIAEGIQGLWQKETNSKSHIHTSQGWAELSWASGAAVEDLVTAKRMATEKTRAGRGLFCI